MAPWCVRAMEVRDGTLCEGAHSGVWAVGVKQACMSFYQQEVHFLSSQALAGLSGNVRVIFEPQFPRL